MTQRCSTVLLVFLLLAACDDKTSPSPQAQPAAAQDTGAPPPEPSPPPVADTSQAAPPDTTQTAADTAQAGDTESSATDTALAATDTAPSEPQIEPWAPDRKCIEQPLSDAERAIFMGTAADDPPPKLDGAREELENKHYLASDEWNLHLYEPKIDALGEGGAYVGIGTDQAYFFTGWMKPQLTWAIDYDPVVVDLHAAYRAFFLAAETPKDFIYFWKRKGVGIEAIEAAYADDPKKEDYIMAYRMGRRRVFKRFSRLLEEYEKRKTKAFINDKKQYRYVRAMVEQGCVRSMLGNLLADKGLVGIGKASHQLGIPVRALYLSNAEMYWDYTDQFKTNVRAMNFDEKSLILRTWASLQHNDDYRYNYQSAKLFLDYLDADWVEGVSDIIRFRSIKGPEDIDFFHSHRTPEERYERIRKRKEREEKKKEK